MSAPAPSVSVVICALDEANRIGRALEATRLPGVERIVVDGGSSDGTADRAREHGAERVLASARGRARQMERGYREARGRVVLFLHADTRLESGWLGDLERALADPSVAGGAFRLGLDAPGRRYRLMERGVALRCAWLGLPFGDQGLFVRREVLERAGGVAQAPIFEDLDLVRTIRRAGRLARLPSRAWTSARRYERNGWLRQVLRNWLALAAWSLGIDRMRVVRWYRRRPAR